MCIICIMNNRSLTKKEFGAAFDSNHHGFGFAFSDGNNVTYSKGYMKKKEAWGAYQRVPVPHVAHFRIQSAGGVSPELTHPFKISRESEIEFAYHAPTPVLFHNGTISDWKTMLMCAIMQIGKTPTQPMSDSRAMAIMISLSGEDALDLFSGSNKFTIVSTDGIKKFGTWIEDDGNFFSNRSYQAEKVTFRGAPSQWKLDDRGFVVKQAQFFNDEYDD